MYRNGLTNPNLGYVDNGEPLSDKRPQDFGRVPVKKRGLKPLRWKAECVERRPLRLEGGKDCKVLPILTATVEALRPHGKRSESRQRRFPIAYPPIYYRTLRLKNDTSLV